MITKNVIMKKQNLRTIEQLESLIDNARKIMRKDKGLNGDLDRLPMLTWIMFLKFLDDMEFIREQEAQLCGEKYRPTIDNPYRWRDWAAQKDGITGDELITFINQEEVLLPGGRKGKGLFAYLKSLEGDGKSRKDVIAIIFKGTVNRMINGYLLREVINKVDDIHFSSSEETHTLGMLYEKMLTEMRDAAGDSGEFYTPRPVVQFMVATTNPKLGDSVLDPACGTGGFLSEAFIHLQKQCKTVNDQKRLQEQSIFGQEAKPLPYLLGEMNLLLHGLEFPNITYGNTLAQKITEIGDNERVDLILTNPPFGGEEETGIKSNFPSDLQTSETALLFLQYIMRKLKRLEKNKGVPGRAAVVVPNGILFGDGVCARIKEQLLRDFNLHTIVRLPEGVFAPYTDIPTNIIFFDKGGPTKETWFYEQPIAEIHRTKKNPRYSKTKPMQYSEFEECLTWWSNRKDNDFAWKVSADVISLNNYNLDIKNPNSIESLVHLPPTVLLDNILEKEQMIINLMNELKSELRSR